MKTAVVSEYMPFDEATCKFDFSAKHHYVYDEDLSLTALQFLAKTSNSANIFAGLTGGEGEVLKVQYTQENCL